MQNLYEIHISRFKYENQISEIHISRFKYENQISEMKNVSRNLSMGGTYLTHEKHILHMKSV